MRKVYKNRAERTGWLRQYLIPYLNRISAVVPRWLNMHTAQIRTRTWKVLLAVFCIASIAANISNITTRRDMVVIIPKADPPVYLGKTSALRSPNVSLTIPSSLRSFCRQLDSLQATAVGRHLHDSILRSRPGLIDSLYLVEQLYRVPF